MKEKTKDLQEELKDFYRSIPSKYYVGEWHSHPSGGTLPSSKDNKAMKQISECEGVSINKPILCIIGYTKQDFQIQFHLIINNKIYTYEKFNFTINATDFPLYFFLQRMILYRYFQ